MCRELWNYVATHTTRSGATVKKVYLLLEEAEVKQSRAKKGAKRADTKDQAAPASRASKHGKNTHDISKSTR